MALFGLGKKKETACCCGAGATPESVERAEDTKRESGVKVLGGGCAKCHELEANSQIAEALGHALAGDAFESYSAGTALKAAINPDAVRLMKQLYGIDMEKSQRPKLLADIPAVDVVITMGCGVTCPNLPCKRREDWGLEDPTGKPDEAFIAVIRAIEAHVLALRAELARP